ncbi:hypothetical protein OXPF_04690 [Oxobacter pfennigii]|uniref:Uncharacterized protein n=1 Tax=Oxobacter pfennigii TaxID=36849 RepID=A0A0P8Z1K6_9CLOT|nr:hypothetical protein [Oxobacter pfennigii]KPU45989.1 hypothetical protein OXPF_04690 [Oxobacter pfennigii]
MVNENSQAPSNVPVQKTPIKYSRELLLHQLSIECTGKVDCPKCLEIKDKLNATSR